MTSTAEDTTKSKELTQLPGTPIIAYTTTKEAITKLRQRFTHLLALEEITDKKDPNYDKVKSAWRELQSLRTGTESERKEQKKISLKHGKLVDSYAGDIESGIRSMEDPMHKLWKTVDDEEDRKKREAIEVEENRINAIRNNIAGIEALGTETDGLTVSELKKVLKTANNVCIGTVYEEFVTEANDKLSSTIRNIQAAIVLRQKFEDEEKDRKEEAARLARQKAEQDAAQKKLDDEKAEFERQQQEARDRAKAEQDEKDRIEREAKIAADAKLETEKRIERERHEAEAKRQQEADAKAAEEKAQLEEKQRQRDRLPDKNKLMEFYNSLMVFWAENHPYESLQSKDVKNILAKDSSVFADTIHKFIKKAEKL